MAERINGQLYRVGLDNEYNCIYITAETLEDLIHYLVDQYEGERSIFGVKRLDHNGNLHTVSVTDHPLYQKLAEEKARNKPYRITMIDGKPWAVLLPTGGTESDDRFDIWDRATRAAALRNDLLHYHTILSLCRDHAYENNTCIGRGCMAVHYRTSIPTETRREYYGFRPMLIPLNPKTFQPDTQRLIQLRDGSRLQLGTLYMNDKAIQNPQNPVLNGDIPEYQPEAKLQIKDSMKDKRFQINWIKIGNALLCDRNLIRNISWNDLEKLGLVFGKIKPDQLRAVPVNDQLQKAETLKYQQGRGETHNHSLSEMIR